MTAEGEMPTESQAEDALRRRRRNVLLGVFIALLAALSYASIFFKLA